MQHTRYVLINCWFTAYETKDRRQRLEDDVKPGWSVCGQIYVVLGIVDLGEHHRGCDEIHVVLGIVDLGEHNTVCGRSTLYLE